MGLVIITLIVFPFEYEYQVTSALVWGTLIAFLLTIWTYPSVTWFRTLSGKVLSWKQRDRTENILSVLLVLFVVMVIVAILSGLVFDAVSADPIAVKATIGAGRSRGRRWPRRR